jgi:hypothetical protein
MEHRWNETDRGKPKYSEKNLSQWHFVHQNPMWTDQGSNPATNRLSHGTTTCLTCHIQSINLLKPSGNFTYHQIKIKKFYVVPTLCFCVLYGSQNKQQLLPYKTLRDWFL